MVLVRDLLIAVYGSSQSTEQPIVRWLHTQIEYNRTDLFGDPDTELVSEASIRRFVVHGRKPHDATLDTFVVFLETMGVLDREHSFLVELRPRKRPLHVSYEGPHADFFRLRGLGTYFSELLDEPTCLNVLILGRSSDELSNLAAYRAVRHYERRENEGEVSFARRLDDGDYDHLGELSGAVRAYGNSITFSFRGPPGSSIWEQRSGVVSRGDDSNFVFVHRAKYLRKEPYLRIAPTDPKDIKQYPNLTKRQKNNIMKYRPRYLEPVSIQAVRRIMNEEPSELDVQLIHAARDQKPVEMMAAIYAGADVNAVDPQNGKSVLHYAAETNNLFVLAVLIYERDVLFELKDAIAKDTDLDPIAVELAVRKAQSQLNPISLDHDHLFASELMDCPGLEPEDFEDPTADLRDKLYWFVAFTEQDALVAAGLSDALNDQNVVPLSKRMEALSTFDQDQPLPPALL